MMLEQTSEKTYSITNGAGVYIRKDCSTNKYVAVRSKTHATTWNNLKKANNVLRSLSRDMKKSFYIEEAIDDDSRIMLEASNEGCAESKDVKAIETIAKTDDCQEGETLNGSEWIRQLSEALRYLDKLDDRLIELNNTLNNINKEVTDMYHYIEFKKLDAAQGYKAYRKLHEILQKRRAIEDEIYVASAIKDYSAGEFCFDIPIRMIEGMKTRKYEPRALGEVFAGGL